MPFVDIRELLADMIQRGHFPSEFFSSVPAIYEMVCVDCGLRLRNEGYGLAECPDCRSIGTLIPDPDYPTIETRLDIHSRVAFQLRYNPAYLEELAVSRKKFHAVITHLCIHILMDHPLRQLEAERLRGYYDEDVKLEPGKNLERDIVATAAADFVSNYYTLKQYRDEAGLEDLGLRAKDWGLEENLSFEDYLKALEEMVDTHPERFLVNPLQGKLTSLHRWSIRDADGVKELLEKAETDMSKRELLDAVMIQMETVLTFDLPEHLQRALSSFENGGHAPMPGFMRTRINEILRLKKDLHWTSLIATEVATGDPHREETSWAKVNRRSYGLSRSLDLHKLVTLPGKRPVPGYKVLFLIDSSGSMGRRDVGLAMGAVLALHEAMPHMAIYVAWADTQIYRTDFSEFRDPEYPDEDVYLSIHKVTSIAEVLALYREGCGGTCFTNPIAQAMRTLQPDSIVYFTDGQGDNPQVHPPVEKFTWVVPRKTKYGPGVIPAKWGKVIWTE